jgi:hypothetical protein
MLTERSYARANSPGNWDATTLPYWQVMRAQMVLLAAQGLRNDQIAARLNCRREVVSQWRKRFFESRLRGLEDRPRRGRPPTFPPSRAC